MSAILAALVLAAAPSSTVGRDPEYLLVPRSTFDCLLKHIGGVKPRDRLRIDIRSCPARVTSHYVPPEDSVELILDLDRSELACLQSNRRRIGRFATREGEFYRIDLKTCRPPPPR
jgi:hypothetical protein